MGIGPPGILLESAADGVWNIVDVTGPLRHRTKVLRLQESQSSQKAGHAYTARASVSGKNGRDTVPHYG